MLETDVGLQVAADRCKYTSCCRQMYVYKLLQTDVSIQVAEDGRFLLQTDIFKCLQTDLQRFLNTRYITSEKGSVFSKLCVDFA